MGCKTTKDGLSLQFYDRQGQPDGPPVFGPYAKLYGRRRNALLASVETTPDEQMSPGSDDWLTLIAVADSQERLDAILNDTTVDASTPETSLSSRRVTVELHVGDDRRTCKDRITLASGAFTSLNPPKINVNHVKVLAAETRNLTDLPEDSEIPRSSRAVNSASCRCTSRNREKGLTDMGCTPAKDGLSVQLYDEKGRPDGAPLYGLYAELRGMDREQITGIEQSPDEINHQGSGDWLTLIAVADTKEKLHEILTHHDCADICTPETSASSHRATVEVHIGGIRQTFANRITIASGPFTQLHPKPKIDVAHVKVLAEHAQLDRLGAKHPLVIEFEGSAFAVENLRKMAEREGGTGREPK